MITLKIKHTKFILSAFILSTVLLLSGCGKSGSSVDQTTNLTGEWVGTGFLNGGNTRIDLKMTITQEQVTTAGTSEASGNILIQGLCVFVFSGAQINSQRKTFAFNEGSVSLNSSFTLTSITGSIASTQDPTQGDTNGCGIFRADVRFSRA